MVVVGGWKMCMDDPDASPVRHRLLRFGWSVGHDTVDRIMVMLPPGCERPEQKEGSREDKHRRYSRRSCGRIHEDESEICISDTFFVVGELRPLLLVVVVMGQDMYYVCCISLVPP